MAEPTDAELVTRVRRGDEGAFSLLVERYHPLLVSTAGALVRNRAVAEELAQESWISALDNLAAFEGRGSLAGWLSRIAANRARDAIAKEGRSVSLDDAGASPPSVDPHRFDAMGAWDRPPIRWTEETPELLVSRSQTRTALEDAITALPPMMRAVLTLRDVDGLSSADVCQALELTEANQRVLLHRARSRVRAVLERYADAF